MSNEAVFKVGDNVMCVYPDIRENGLDSQLEQLKTYKIIEILSNHAGPNLLINDLGWYYSSRFLNLSRVNKDKHTQNQIKFINNILKNFPELMATEFIEFDKTGMFKIRE